MDQTKKLPKIGEILSVSVEATKEHFLAFMRVILPYVGLTVLQAIAAPFIEELVGFIIWLIILIATIVYGIYMGIVLTRMCYQAVMTNKVDEKKAKKNWGKAVWPMIAVGIITGLAIMFGTLLFVVPGVILWLMYFAAQYLVVIDGKKIGESLSTSIKLAKGRKGDLFVKLFVSYLVVGIIYSAAIGIVAGVFGGIGALISEDVAAILVSVGTAIVVLPFVPVFTNIATFVFGHLKKLNGMK